MHKPTQHLNDEHMRLYEWNGAGMQFAFPAKSKRTHPWHASYGVLALLTSLLALNACDNTGPTEQAGEQLDQAVKEMKEQAARSLDEPR